MTIVAMALPSGTLLAQNISDKCAYRFERLENKTPWIVSENGAGLVFNNALNFSNAEAYYGYQDGDFKNFNEAAKYDNFGIQTKSYVKAKKVYFYGMFNYDYGIKHDQTWLGTIYPNATLNPILDSVPGKVLREDYILAGKVGYPINRALAVGIAFDYHTATAAKRTDGRNSNTLSKFSVSPGVTYSKGIFVMGLNLAYKHNVERVDYDFIGDLTGKSIYYMEGLWFTYKTGITSTTITKRAYFTNIYGGAAQLEIKGKDLNFFNQIKVDYNRESDFEDESLLKRYAFTEGLKYDYKGLITYRGNIVDHNLSLVFSSDEQFAYNVVNNYEQIPDEINSWRYFEYGKTLRYIQQVQHYGAEYKGYIKRNDCSWNSSWIFTLGTNYISVKKDYKIYPAKYHQDYTNTEIYADVNKNFKLKKKGFIDLNVGGSYTNGEGTMLEVSNPITTGSLLLNNTILKHDFAYQTADRAKVGVGAKYTRIINPEKGTTAYVGANYNHQFLVNDGNLSNILDGVLPGTYRYLISVNIGLNF